MGIVNNDIIIYSFEKLEKGHFSCHVKEMNFEEIGMFDLI